MDNQEVIEKYGIQKKTGIQMLMQISLVILALILTIVGITYSLDSFGRFIIYVCQAVSCIIIISYGLITFKKRDVKYFKSIINSYAFLEAARVAIIDVSGVSPIAAFLSKFLLTILACNCVLLSERLETKESNFIAHSLLVLECILYVIFLIGFPSVIESVLHLALPFVGVLIAGSLCLFNLARIEQEKNTNKE